MAGNIKGITVEIGGDTVGLQNALRDVNKRSKDLQTELKSVERLLKFDPGNTQLIAQQQQILGEQVANTAEKLDRLKQAQAQVEEQFRRGDIGADQYRAFQREIVATEGQLNGLRRRLSQVGDNTSVSEVRQEMRQLSNDTEEAQGSVKELGGELTNLAAGAAAGLGIKEVIENALEASSLDTTIDISFQVPEESKGIIKGALKEIQAYGVEGEAALEGVRRQWALNLDQTNEQNQAVVKGAAAISHAYSDIDFTELIQEVNEMSNSMGLSQEEALGMTNTLLKMGFPPDQLDIITEYGSQLARAGYNAQEIQGIMAAGVQTGTWNIDVLLDGLKEGRIVLAEFGQGVDKTTAQMIQGTGISAKQLEEWGKAVAAGGEGGKKAMSEVAQAVANIDEKTKQNQVGVKIFGTLWEENGTKITDTLINAGTWTGNLKTNQDGLNQSVSQLNADPQVRLNQALSDMNTSLTPLLISVAEFVAKVADWASENPKLTATIVAITSALGILIGVGMAMAGVLGVLTAAGTAFEIGLAPLIAIILAVMAAIAAVIAIGVILYKNWDTIKTKAVELWNKLGPFKGVFLALTGPIGLLVAAGVALYKNWDTIKEKASQLKQKIANLFSGIKWELPHIKLPHFSISGKFSLKPGDVSIPKVSVDWFKDGGLFPANSPRLVGIGDANVPEAALPLSDKVLGTIASMIAERMPNFNPQPSKQPLIVQMITPNARVLAEMVVDDITQIQNYKTNRSKLF